jgi:hypothetical protein
MATLNKKARSAKGAIPRATTHGGAQSSTPTHSPLLQLRRLVMANMLWEDQFYIDGASTEGLIQTLVPQVDPIAVADLAVVARERGKLRHVPLLLVRELARLRSERVKALQANPRLRAAADFPSDLVAETLEKVIQRPDELTEFLALYWKDGKQPLSAQVKKGLARAFGKFTDYQFAKYDRDGAVKLRDVMFLTHPNPANCSPKGYNTLSNTDLYKKIAERQLTPPDTWEVVLSSGANKTKTWERLIEEKKLGGLATLRNLRNMQEAKLTDKTIRQAIEQANYDRVLPFRFISAAKYAPKFEPELEQAMYRAVENLPKLDGKTVIAVDISGSMNSGMSGKTDLNRMDAAIALTILIRELSEEAVVYATAGNDGTRIHKTKLMPSRRGFALRDVIKNSYYELGGGGIFLTQATNYIAEREDNIRRLIVITDEQDTDTKLNPSLANPTGDFNYIINIAAYQNGVGAKGKWDKVDGFSEAVVDYIQALESEGLNLQVV